MDVSFFKNRGRTFMGDICQKVECMLHEVDGVIKQGMKNQSADRGKTSKMSVDDFFSEVFQGLHMANPSSPDKKSATARKSPAKVEDKPAFISADQFSESDDITNSICNSLLDVDDKPGFIISEKSELKPTIFTEKNLNHKKVSEPDTVNKPGGLSSVSTESVEGEAGKIISQENLDMIIDENFMSNKYDEVNNHFSISSCSVKVEVEPFPFNEDRFDASVKLLEDNVKDVRWSRSGEGTEDHTLMQNINAVYDQFLEETAALLIPECTSAAVECSGVEISEMGTKSITNHHDDLADAVNWKFYISPSVGNTCADADTIRGFHSYKKENLQIQVPSVDDLTELGMETVDLSDEVTYEESSSVIINAKDLYAVSDRVQQLRSFRKKIQDAFTTKRRLAKEYEQLAIWYGDIEIDCSKQYKTPQDSTSITVSSDAKDQQKHQSGDSEWVML